ncbi:hypothetical protein Acor_21450 [Acrocarpospora corrugata]|uniref:Uncharacterized protein n=1 Tax=Acrocarpospora corrugata TaxID=35763 RepID=A0A5M3VWL2_9ACTN|nr:hypothetical protein [Acrocarpospora corrugata]GES00082.1 hypothetical protein Acor_21450 [Acrocarpospora corrugata]
MSIRPFRDCTTGLGEDFTTEPAGDDDVSRDGPFRLVSAGPRPSAVRPRYQALREHGPFANFADFVDFTTRNEELTADLLEAPASPHSPDAPMAQYWLAQARRVASDSLADLGPLIWQSATLWRAIGRSLNLTETDRANLLAELYWTKGRDNEAFDEELVPLDAHLRKAGLFEDFYMQLAMLRDGQALPDTAPIEMATTKAAGYRDYRQAAAAATKFMEKRVSDLQTRLLREHRSHQEWLREMAGLPELDYDRSLDRLADVLTSLKGDRVCVAILTKAARSGITANRPDGLMAEDLEALLRASRAVGSAAEAQLAELTRLMTSRLSPEAQPTSRAKARFQARLRKTVAFLRTLEQSQGRIRVIGYNSALPVAGDQDHEQEMHAEMQALAISLNHPKGAKLGVAKLCRIKCWMVLQDVWPGVFDRMLATHMTTYPWPPPLFLAKKEPLTRLYGGSLTERPKEVEAALAHPVGLGPLMNAFAHVKGRKITDDTGYASSGDDAEPLPSSPVPPPAGPDQDFQDYLGTGVQLTSAEELAAQGPARPSPISGASARKVTESPLTKVKRSTSVISPVPVPTRPRSSTTTTTSTTTSTTPRVPDKPPTITTSRRSSSSQRKKSR